MRLRIAAFGAALAATLLLAAPADAQRRKATELEQLLKQSAGRDFAASAKPFLDPYAGATIDLRSAYLVDQNWYVSNNSDMNRLLNDMAAVLLRGWTGPAPNLLVMVQADGVPNAFADGAGIITISAGMIEELQTADAVAAVLAHEIAHILLGHPEQRRRTAEMMRAAVGLVSSGAVYAEMGSLPQPANPAAAKPAAAKPAARGKAQPAVAMKFSFTPAVADRMVTGYLADSLVTEMLMPVAKGRQEFEADRLAADLLVLSPFPSDNQAVALEVLAKSEAAASSRLGRASDMLAGMAAYRLLTAAAGTDRTAQAGAALGAGLAAVGIKCVMEGLGRIGGGEAKPEERRKRYREYGKVYGADGFPLADESHAELVAFRTRMAAIRASAPWQQSLHAARISADAHRALSFTVEKQGARGCGKSEIAVEPPPLPPLAALAQNPQIPRSYLVRGLAAFKAGQYPEAMQALEYGARLPHFPASGYELLGQAQIHNRNRDGLAATIARANEQSGRDRRQLPLMVALAVMDKQPDRAEQLAARCLLDGGADVYAKCRGYLGYDAACAPRTEAGKQAFGAASMARSLRDLMEVQRTAGGEGSSVQCQTANSAAAAITPPAKAR